jgi:ABC-type transporter Mla MlaB component
VLDDSGGLRLVLSGELHLAVADMLVNRLPTLWDEGHAVRPDLAELALIPSSGLQALIAAR